LRGFWHCRRPGWWRQSPTG